MAGAIGDKHGFTLTELLVVVGILVLLTAIVVPNITGQLTKGRMHGVETQIAEIEVALEAYHADFGTYPGDVFPTEDINNDGRFGDGEDGGVDVDRDGTPDYGAGNDRLDRGDGLVNIDDLEWALRTTEHNGPYMDSIPKDSWGQKYVYYAPLTRPTSTSAYLYMGAADPSTDLPPMVSEDSNENGILDDGEDVGIMEYPSIAGKYAGRGNKILDHGDDDNKDGIIQTNFDNDPLEPLEYGNKDISPDGFSRNIGFYLYSVGRNKRDETATGYEDINFGEQDGSSVLNTTVALDDGTSFSEDIDEDGTLDTGYEDTGIDGIPGTKDRGEGDWDAEDPGNINPTTTNETVSDATGQPDEEFGTKDPDHSTYAAGDENWHYNTHMIGVNDADNEGFDIGGDDINSWNKERPWREHPSYGG